MSETPEGGRSTVFRYLREPNGAIEHETYDQNEGRLRFTAAITHIALVRFLLLAGGETQFPLSAAEADDMMHYEIGVQAKDNVARLVLFRKPDEQPTTETSPNQPQA